MIGTAAVRICVYTLGELSFTLVQFSGGRSETLTVS
jgi:hypothetical protein